MNCSISRGIFFALQAGAFVGASLAMADGASAATSVPLAFFELQVGASPSLGAAKAFVDQRTASLAEAKDRAGTQAFESNDLGPHHAVVTSTMQRSYFRVEQEVGVRFPVLGARAEQQATIVAAIADQQLARFAYDQTRLQLLGQIRKSYVNYWAARRRQEVAGAFIAALDAQRRAVKALRASGFWTTADLLNYEDLIEGARLDVRQARVDQQNARALLELVTNARVAPFEAIEPPFAACATTADRALSSALAGDIELAKLGAQRDEANQLGGLLRWIGYDASLDVGLRGSYDAPGGAGYSLLVGTTFGIPLHVSRVRDDRAQYIAAQLKQYDMLERQRRAEITVGVQSAVMNWAAAAAALEQARRHERTQEEDLREARVRLRYIAPGTMSDVLTKAQNAYKARSAVAADEEAVLLRISDLLNLAPSACVAAGGTSR